MNTGFAQAWTQAMGSDIDALAAMYSDDCVIEAGTYADSVGEAITTKDGLRREMGQFANTDAGNGLGVHTFEATNYEGHERHGIIQWRWSGEHLSTYRGLPVEGRTLTTVGQTFQQYDTDGKIVRESTYWNDVKVLKELGIPVDAAHYWDA